MTPGWHKQLRFWTILVLVAKSQIEIGIYQNFIDSIDVGQMSVLYTRIGQSQFVSTSLEHLLRSNPRY